VGIAPSARSYVPHGTKLPDVI